MGHCVWKNLQKSYQKVRITAIKRRDDMELRTRDDPVVNKDFYGRGNTLGTGAL